MSAGSGTNRKSGRTDRTEESGQAVTDVPDIQTGSRKGTRSGETVTEASRTSGAGASMVRTATGANTIPSSMKREPGGEKTITETIIAGVRATASAESAETGIGNRMNRIEEPSFLKDKERIDDLQRNGYRIIQHPEKFCFGMDAVLLSGFAMARRGEQVLDLCTGTGIIPILMEAKTEAAHLTGPHPFGFQLIAPQRSYDLRQPKRAVNQIKAPSRFKQPGSLTHHVFQRA